MNDERRLSDADVDRIANAVAARLRDEGDDPKSTRVAESGGTADPRNADGRRLPPSQRRGKSARRDHSRSEQVETTGGRVRDDVAARADDKRGIERLEESRAAGDTDRDGPDAPSEGNNDAGITLEATLDEDGQVAIPAEIVAELDVEAGDGVRLTVRPAE